jgi:hypothetical protein
MFVTDEDLDALEAAIRRRRPVPLNGTLNSEVEAESRIFIVGYFCFKLSAKVELEVKHGNSPVAIALNEDLLPKALKFKLEEEANEIEIGFEFEGLKNFIESRSLSNFAKAIKVQYKRSFKYCNIVLAGDPFPLQLELLPKFTQIEFNYEGYTFSFKGTIILKITLSPSGIAVISPIIGNPALIGMVSSVVITGGLYAYLINGSENSELGKDLAFSSAFYNRVFFPERNRIFWLSYATNNPRTQAGEYGIRAACASRWDGIFNLQDRMINKYSNERGAQIEIRRRGERILISNEISKNFFFDIHQRGKVSVVNELARKTVIS